MGTALIGKHGVSTYFERSNRIAGRGHVDAIDVDRCLRNRRLPSIALCLGALVDVTRGAISAQPVDVAIVKQVECLVDHGAIEEGGF